MVACVFTDSYVASQVIETGPLSGRIKRRGIRKTPPRREQPSWVLKHEEKFARKQSNPDMLFTCQSKGSMRNLIQPSTGQRLKKAAGAWSP